MAPPSRGRGGPDGRRPRSGRRWVHGFAGLSLLAGVAGAPEPGQARRPSLRDPAAVHVFTFADKYTDTLCHLARTVEAAGGWLRVLGLRDGEEFRMPWGEIPFTRPDEPWHIADKATLLKKHWFMSRVLRGLPANATVIFVDAYDVLFQSSLHDLVAAYHRVAEPRALAANGRWPVLFSGEINCWPYKHDRDPGTRGGRIPVYSRAGPRYEPNRYHTIREDASMEGQHHSSRRFPYGHESPWNIRGDGLCSEWLTQHDEELRERGSPGDPYGANRFPFICTGAYIGTAASLNRLYLHLWPLYRETMEFYDQGLVMLLLLRNRSLGMIDTRAEVFYSVHGHDEFVDLERPLCRGGYFAPSAAAAGLAGLSPPPLQRGAAPKVLHFNGNGKRHLQRCVEEFGEAGVLGSHCTFYDEDRGRWQRVR